MPVHLIIALMSERMYREKKPNKSKKEKRNFTMIVGSRSIVV